MEESIQSLNKAKNMAAQEVRRIGLGEDVVGLVTEDIEFGLSTEEVFRYAKSGMNIKQMKVYSECLRKKFGQEVIDVITSDSLNASQMSVVVDFYERGVPIETIKEVIQNKNNAFEMSKIYQGVLDNMAKADSEMQVAPEYVQSLFEEIKKVVLGIKFDESRYDELNEKLKIFETFKEDVSVRDNLVKQLSDKDTLLSDQQDKINQANSTIARLREEKETVEKETRAMRARVSEMEAEILENKKIIHDYREKEDMGITNDTKKPLTETVPSIEIPVNRKESTNLYLIPAYYHIPIMDETGRVIQTVPMEPMQKKSNGVVSLIAKIGFKKKSRQDIVKLVAGGELVPEQLVQIRIAIEKGLKENQLLELIHNKIPAEHMMEIIEIAVLENSMEY